MDGGETAVAEETVADRLKAVRAAEGASQADLAARLSIPLGTIKKIEGGLNMPGGETLMKYSAAGYSPTWILTGWGAMRIGRITKERADTPAIATSDLVIAASELLALVTDAIQRAYKEAGAGISGLDLGRLSAEKYNEIISEAPDPEDWRGAVRMMAAQLRKDISATAADTTNRKREAS